MLLNTMGRSKSATARWWLWIAMMPAGVLLSAASVDAGLRDDLAPYIPFELSTEEWGTLEAAKDLYRLGPGDGLREGLAVAVIASAPERVYEVVTGNDDFDEFMPYVAVSFLEEDLDGSLVNYQCLNLPWPVSNRHYRVRLTNTEPAEEEAVWRSAWTFVSGNVIDSQGSWTLMRTAENTTRVVYRVLSDPGGGWGYLKNKATKKGLEPLLESVRRRSEDPTYLKSSGGIPSSCESPPD
jgi:hypothetical protein